MPIAPEIKAVIGQFFLTVKHWFKMFVIIIVAGFVLVNLIMATLQIFISMAK